MTMLEDEIRKMYTFGEWVRNTEGMQIDGRNHIYLLESFFSMGPALAAVERLARDLERRDCEARFDMRCNEKNILAVVPIGRAVGYFYALKVFLKQYAYEDRFVFSPHVAAVGEALEAMQLHPLGFEFCNPDSYDHARQKYHAEIFNEFVAKARLILRSSRFREALRTRRRNAERNEAKGLAIEEKVFAAKSRTLVLMLHFGYLQEYRQKITLEEIQLHRRKFFNNCRSNKLLRGIVDYIWKLEEGDESGLHLHVLIFYTAESCRDVYIAQQIGEYWKTAVTGGKGQYWNSNANKWLHQIFGHGVGTGEIEWHEEEKREALRTNIRYMTKADQFLRVKYGAHSRLFGTSAPQPKKREGRPRVLPGGSGSRAVEEEEVLDDA